MKCLRNGVNKDMTKEQKAIVKLYKTLDDINTRCKKRDLSFARVASISGCDMYQGLPPISRIIDGVYNEFEDVIFEAIQAQAIEDTKTDPNWKLK